MTHELEKKNSINITKLYCFTKQGSKNCRTHQSIIIIIIIENSNIQALLRSMYNGKQSLAGYALAQQQVEQRTTFDHLNKTFKKKLLVPIKTVRCCISGEVKH